VNPPPGKNRDVGSKTGALPRIDLEPEIQHEPPPPPPTLPEIDGDAGSITGMVPRPQWAEEGEDHAKQDDDSATVTPTS
jgi:hypothetical protein